MSQDEIAEVIGCTRPTLAKWFAHELRLGAAHIKAEMIMARYNSAKAGNVSAQTKMIDMGTDAVPKTPAAPKAKAQPKLGKKEQAIKDANAAPEDAGWSEVLEPSAQKH